MNTKRSLTSCDEPVETALAVLSAGLASVDEVADAVAARRAQRPTIGQLLLLSHKLTVHQVFQILSEQATNAKLFGQIAVEKGFISQADVDEALLHQSSMCPPLCEVLVSCGVITAEQAAAVWDNVRCRLRQPSDEALAKCEA